MGQKFTRKQTSFLDVVFFSVIFTVPAFSLNVSDAQGDVSQDFASWTGVHFQGDLSTRSGYYLELQNRLNQTISSGNRFIVRPALRYYITPELSLWAGYGWLPAFSPFQNENRLWQQALYQTKTGALQLIGRFRIDERWISNTDGVALRGRLMLRTLWALDQESKLSLCASDEYFQNFNTVTAGPESGFDQNRFFLGINYLIAKSVQVESGYMNVFVNQAGSTNSILNHVLAMYTIFNM